MEHTLTPGAHYLVKYTVSKVSVARVGEDGVLYWGGGSNVPFEREDGVELLAELTAEQSATIEGGDRATEDGPRPPLP